MKQLIFKLVMEIVRNRILVTSIVAWLIAQVVKTLLYLAVHRKLDLSRLTGDGGMPSAHSATVTALAVRTLIDEGAGSSIFAVAAILAIVVMHDAMGVRRESGRHAQAINELVDLMDPDVKLDVKLKEFIGHTPTQVVAGAIVGCLVALFLGMK